MKKNAARAKAMLRGLLWPPLWLMLPLMLGGFGLLVWVFVMERENTPIAYAAYGASAWALTVLIARTPRIARWCRRTSAQHPLIRRAANMHVVIRAREDRAYRQQLTLYAGLCLNLLYTTIKATAAALGHSLWFGTLAAYYLLLSLMRFMLARQMGRSRAREDLQAEWKRYRQCGGVLLVMNQALGVMVFLAVRRDYSFHYPGYLIYAMAAYAFYAITMAIINLARNRKRDTPVLSAARATSLVAALVSMLALETALLAQFSSAEETQFRRHMLLFSGGVVCLLVLAMAVYMLVHATKRLRALRRKK